MQKKILIIDDHWTHLLKREVTKDTEEYYNSLMSYLKKRNISLKTAFCVGWAMDLIKKEKFDLVICDMGLPFGSWDSSNYEYAFGKKEKELQSQLRQIINLQTYNKLKAEAESRGIFFDDEKNIKHWLCDKDDPEHPAAGILIVKELQKQKANYIIFTSTGHWEGAVVGGMVAGVINIDKYVQIRQWLDKNGSEFGSFPGGQDEVYFLRIAKNLAMGVKRGYQIPCVLETLFSGTEEFRRSGIPKLKQQIQSL